MKKTATFVLIILLLLANAVFGGTFKVYENKFDSSEDLDGTKVGEGSTSIEAGQLKAEITSDFGHLTYILNGNKFNPAYQSIISENPGLITWSFNLSNEDDALNNGYHFVLLSTKEDPFDLSAQGYFFCGGGMALNRMGLWRFDNGLGGGQEALIDIANGLGTLPDKGSFKITYNPSTDEWSLFGQISEDYANPAAVTTSLGSAIDDIYINSDTPYSGLGGVSSGYDYFDNILITIEDTTPPAVVSTTPGNEVVDVNVNTPITITFSEVIDSATITTSSLLVNNGSVNIAGSIVYDGTKAIFTPASPLESSKTYTVTIMDEASDYGDNPLVSDYTFSFTAKDIIPPTITLTTPVNNSSNVSLSASVTAQFSEVMDTSTITASSFLVNNGSANITGSIAYSDKTATFTPASTLESNKTYTVTISKAATDLGDNPLQNDYAFSFRTITTTSESSAEGSGGGCFIATAAYGSILHPKVVTLREFRDQVLLKHRSGMAFVDFYYRHSPPIANFIAGHEVIRMFVRWGLFPLIWLSQLVLWFGFWGVIMFFLALTIIIGTGLLIAKQKPHRRMTYCNNLMRT